MLHIQHRVPLYENYTLCKSDTLPAATDKINTQIIQRRDELILHCYRGLTVRKALLDVI
jgi:hypothetical protein